MATLIKSLTTIYANDILKAADFYGRLLNLEETYRFPLEGVAEHIEYRVGTTTLAISSPAACKRMGCRLPPQGTPLKLDSRPTCCW
jgi:hypothetical protein